MKKIILVIVVLLVANNAFSQAKFGIKAGVNFSSLSDVEYSSTDGTLRFIKFKNDEMATGYHVGVFANVSLGKIISFQPELLFSMQGGKMQYYELPVGDYEGVIGSSGLAATLKLTYQLGYIQIPLLLEIKPVADLGVLFGPQLSFNVSRKCTSTYDGYTETFSGSRFYYLCGTGFKKRDVSLVFGLQYTFIEKIVIGARYNLGLINNWDYANTYDKSKGWKSSVIQASLGYLF